MPDQQEIYLDSQATTRIDADVLDAMVRFEQESFANPGSVTHEAGRRAALAIGEATAEIAGVLRCRTDELIFTSGATESNNLAILGFCLHRRQKRRIVVSCKLEHRAVLDPIERLKSEGFEVRWIETFPQGHSHAGQIKLDQAESILDESVALVSLMLANNEIGTLQPLQELSRLCQKHGIVLHSDASQAIGHIECNPAEIGVDLLSFSSHKFYGPKGVGGLYVRQADDPIAIRPLFVGGGQQQNLRAGTLNSTGIIGMAAALRSCQRKMVSDGSAIRRLRDRLWFKLHSQDASIECNGPALNSELRLDRNLNCYFPHVEGQSLMLAVPEVCVSSGSACTSQEPEPSHVLSGIGRTRDEARCSIRFGLSRTTREDEIDSAAAALMSAYRNLKADFG